MESNLAVNVTYVTVARSYFSRLCYFSALLSDLTRRTNSCVPFSRIRPSGL